MRRICESVATTVVGGLILWSVTGPTSQPPAAPGRASAAASPATEPTVAAHSPAPVTSTANEAPPARAGAELLVPVAIPGPAVATPPPPKPPQPYSAAVGSILLFENFSGYREGEATDWGPDTFIKTGLDHRNWLVSNVEGTHTAGCRIRLPDEFRFECRYSAHMPEVTRGLMGWWKEPVASKISFLNGQGAKYTIQWVIKCGNDPTRLNPLGSTPLCAKKYYHTIKLPDGSSNEVGVVQPAGILRIGWDRRGVKVSVDGQAAVAGATSPMGHLVGFEIDVVKAKNGMLFFTDFTITR